MLQLFAHDYFPEWPGCCSWSSPWWGKMILPTLGGTSAVWNSCLVFFQVTLLTGYLYAHSLAMRLGIRKQIIVHAVVLLLPLAVLPISFAQSSAPPTESNPTLWLLVQLLLCIGLPFFRGLNQHTFACSAGLPAPRIRMPKTHTFFMRPATAVAYWHFSDIR